MRLLVMCGRNYSNSNTINRELNRLNEQRPIEQIIHSGDQASDFLVSKWAQEKSVPTVVYSADIKEHGARKGKEKRNEQMLEDHAPHGVVLFSKEANTTHMENMANQLGYPVKHVDW